MELSAKDAFIKTLKGDIGFASWGGHYMVDNMTVTAYGIRLPGSETSGTNGGGSGTNPGNVNTGVTLPTGVLVVLFGAAAALCWWLTREKHGHRKGCNGYRTPIHGPRR